jgi:hypothetical protein
MKSKNLVLFGALAVIAIVAFVMFGRGYPPSTGVEGTIGAANRYNAKQISDADVTLKDPAVVAFLQSDTFHQIQTNPELARIVASEQFRTAAADYAKLIENDNFRSLNQGKDFQKIMQTDQFADVAADLGRSLSWDGVRGVLSNDKFAAIMSDAAFQALAKSQDAAQIRSAADLNRVLQKDEYRSLASKDGLRSIQGDLAQALGSVDFRNLVAMPGMDQLAAMAEFRSIVKMDQFAQLMSPDNIRSLVALDHAHLYEADAAHAVDALRALNDDALRNALGNKDFLRAVQDGAIARAMNDALRTRTDAARSTDDAARSQGSESH